MILARITGSVVSTIHHPIVDGHKLLLAERLDQTGKPTGGYLIAMERATAPARYSMTATRRCVLSSSALLTRSSLKKSKKSRKGAAKWAGNEFTVNVGNLMQNVDQDHNHLLVKVPPRVSISKLMGVVKCRTALRLFSRFPQLRQKPYWGNHFWAKGYCVDTVGVDAEIIRKYVKYQEKQELRQQEMNFRK